MQVQTDQITKHIIGSALGLAAKKVSGDKVEVKALQEFFGCLDSYIREGKDVNERAKNYNTVINKVAQGLDEKISEAQGGGQDTATSKSIKEAKVWLLKEMEKLKGNIKAPPKAGKQDLRSAFYSKLSKKLSSANGAKIVNSLDKSMDGFKATERETTWSDGIKAQAMLEIMNQAISDKGIFVEAKFLDLIQQDLASKDGKLDLDFLKKTKTAIAESNPFVKKVEAAKLIQTSQQINGSPVMDMLSGLEVAGEASPLDKKRVQDMLSEIRDECCEGFENLDKLSAQNKRVIGRRIADKVKTLTDKQKAYMKEVVGDAKPDEVQHPFIDVATSWVTSNIGFFGVVMAGASLLGMSPMGGIMAGVMLPLLTDFLDRDASDEDASSFIKKKFLEAQAKFENVLGMFESVGAKPQQGIDGKMLQAITTSEAPTLNAEAAELIASEAS